MRTLSFWAFLTLSTIGLFACGVSDEKYDMLEKEPSTADDMLSFKGTNYSEQTRAFLILSNLSNSPGEFLHFIKQCRIDVNYHKDCQYVLMELTEGIKEYRNALQTGNMQRMANAINLALTAPLDETIISQPARPPGDKEQR